MPGEGRRAGQGPGGADPDTDRRVAVAGFDETTLRSGPAGEKKYVHGAFTEMLTRALRRAFFQDPFLPIKRRRFKGDNSKKRPQGATKITPPRVARGALGPRRAAAAG
jgi:hypothetical protein